MQWIPTDWLTKKTYDTLVKSRRHVFPFLRYNSKYFGGHLAKMADGVITAIQNDFQWIFDKENIGKPF